MKNDNRHMARLWTKRVTAVVVCAVIAGPAAAATAAEKVTFGPFALRTDGSGCRVWFEDKALITGDGMGGIPGPPPAATWKIARTPTAVTATLAYPGVTKRVILRRKDCFVEFGLTAPPAKAGKAMYLLNIAGQTFEGGRVYRCERADPKAVWAAIPSSGSWKLQNRQTVGVLRNGGRLEFQHALSGWDNRSQLDGPHGNDKHLRWRTNFRDISAGKTEWTVYRFTTDPKTPLPPDPADPMYPDYGNLCRDQVSLGSAGFAITLLRSTRAVFRGQPFHVDGRYVDHDGETRTIKYSWKLRDWRDSVVAKGSGQFSTGGAAGTIVQRLVDVKTDRVGCFKLDLEAHNGKAAITHQAVFAVLPKPHWYGRPHDGFFGGHLGGQPSDPWRVRVATMSGVTWVRLHDTNGLPDFRWSFIEPQRGRYVLKEPKSFKQLKAANLRVLGCTHHAAPKWADKRANELWKNVDPAIRKEYPGRQAWYYHPELLDLYKKYLRVMLKDRGHLMDAIEPQNEMYWQKDAIGQLNIVKATREVVDEVAPHMLIVGPTVPPGAYGSPWGHWCKKAGVHKFTDVVAGHFYVGRGPAGLGCEKVMEDWCLGLRSLFTIGGKSKPVWNTEWCTNYPVSFYDHPHHRANTYAPGDPALRLEPHLYATVNVRQFIAMAVHNIKSFWHVYYTGSALDRRLLEYDWTPNPAGVSFSAATFLLDGAKFVDRWNPVPDVRGYVVDTPRGAVAVFFGKRYAEGETATVRFTAAVPGATVRDTMSNAIGPITADRTLTVDNDPVYVTAPEMSGAQLLSHLNSTVVTPPVRGSVVATFLFDQPGAAAAAARVADETGTYELTRTGPEAAGTGRLVKGGPDRGPAAATFEYADNRYLHFPKGCKAMFDMNAQNRLSHVFNATGTAGMGLTVEAWVRLGSPRTGRSWVSGVVFEKNRYRHAPQYRLFIDRESRVRWTHSWGTGDHTYIQLTGPRLSIGKWVHLAGTTEYDGKTMRCRLYVDGRQVKESAEAKRPVEAAFTRVAIGGMYDPRASHILSDASVDEIVVHRRALGGKELGWFKGSRRAALARALASGMKSATAEQWAGFLPIDLSGAVNTQLWNKADPAANDLRNLLPGDWMMAGVPVRILDQMQHGGKAMVTLKGRATLQRPERLTVSFAPFRVEKLHFVHKLSHGGRSKDLALTYVVTHKNGKKSIIKCHNKKELADWWYTGSVDNAKIAWTGANPRTSKVRLYMHTWQNPEPTNQVRSIEMIGGHGPVPHVLAITALCMP